jgi:hypothetical protein
LFLSITSRFPNDEILIQQPRTERPYLKNVKALANIWPHLGLLANFMEVTTSPIRWKDLKGTENEAKRAERASRTNIVRLDYMADGSINRLPIDSPSALRESLQEHTIEDPKVSGATQTKAETTTGAEQEETHATPEVPKPEPIKSPGCDLRLYVVEDLSRDVIELLGSHLDIDPCFFREHIVDYAWFNTRDRWLNPPMLDLISRRQDWFNLRYVSARYHNDDEDYQKARKEAEQWNVLRRPDDDLNNKAYWDALDAKVAIARQRLGFWSRRAEPGKEQVAVLLLDPTIQAGHTLWYGVRNWEPIPSFKTERPPQGPPRKSWFEDFLYWAQRPPYPALRSTAVLSSNRSSSSHTVAGSTVNIDASIDANIGLSPVCRPVQAILHMVGSEWLTMTDYIKTRLTQIDWEISFPEQFIRRDADIDSALKKLHVWRRLVPLYREMLEETIHRVFLFPAPMLPQSHCTLSETCQCAAHTLNNGPNGAISCFHGDFRRIKSYMEEHQSRVDRLTSVVTAVMSITDSRHSMDENRNVASLTWLATFFVPMSFVSSLFSMQTDITQSRATFGWYFAAALPLSFVALGIVWIVTHRHEAYFGLLGKKEIREGPSRYR